MRGEVLLQTIWRRCRSIHGLRASIWKEHHCTARRKVNGIDNRLGRKERTEPESDLMKEMPLIIPQPADSSYVVKNMQAKARYVNPCRRVSPLRGRLTWIM
ncbi:hypothetical protein MLD38_034265 [Melastoma candidum]|uniref:Uncharacterized protein n=1 Tax=Melastoma candidum TaxID=119954 RepID=A0ACB9MAR2_9MYRT|nr:hypothetical protein MLD38_034265 [Melastoma candidum]